MMPKFAAQDADKTLARLDRIAATIQANFKQWGMPFEVAREIVIGLDMTADEVEVAAFGPESLANRQVEVLKTASGRRAEVIKQEPDEPYMSTFKNPMAPIQIEADEPYMKAYGPPDQSSAVLHGESTTGRPLTPHS
jgi:hypothetical protein